LKEIRIHGRGGQGAVLAAELIVLAAFQDNKFGQAFPAFGGERRGAAVQAFIRLDERPIRLRYRVTAPDWILVLDPTLLDVTDVMQGMKQDGLVLINSEHPPSSLGWTQQAQVCCIPATRIALEVLGQPLANTAMLGAFSAVTSAVSLDALLKTFQQRFKHSAAKKNCLAAQSAFDWVKNNRISPQRVEASRPVPAVRPTENYQGLGAPGHPLHFAAVTAPRSSLAYRTGTWRYSRPVFDPEKCSGCGFCEMYCPDTCIIVENKKYYADYEYCKGCGICAHECPEEAILMVPEES
jgi:pyruvate ferredoxin oxidoreductase gamma subunit